jgi:hypothetical protein
MGRRAQRLFSEFFSDPTDPCPADLYFNDSSGLMDRRSNGSRHVRI